VVCLVTAFNVWTKLAARFACVWPRKERGCRSTNCYSLGFPLPTNADAPPVRKVCHNAMFFVPLGLALNEKRIPQTTENTEGSK